MPASRAELLRVDAENEAARQTLRAKLRWCYGDVEGERRFNLQSPEARADLLAWKRITDRGDRYAGRPRPTWTSVATRIARGALMELRDE